MRRFLDRLKREPGRAEPGESLAVPMETYNFKGFEIPVHLMLLTGGGPENFEEISEVHMQNLEREHPIEPGLRVLELGCGIGRDAIPLAERIGPSGSYLGIDIIRDSIEWCARTITPKYPNVRFHFDDVHDTLHNPGGSVDYETVHLPVGAASVDLIVAQSVFTHMLRPELKHYLREFARVLAPDGTIYATCFRATPEILETARRTNLTPWDLRFEYDLGDGCLVNELEHKTGAVAYTEETLTEVIADAGLRLRGDIRPGGWSGCFPRATDGQDALVLEHLAIE